MVTASILQALVDFVTETIGDFGAPAVFVLMTLESACIPVPSEVIQLFAGYLVSQDKMGLVAAIAAGTLGNVAGSWIAWGVGAKGGRPFIDRYGKWVHVTPKRMAMAERWFDRYGNRVVFWSRMLPIVRTFISLPAGVARMPFVRFTIYTFLGALPWVTGLTLLGVWVGDNWETWEGRLKYFDYVVAVVLVGIAVYLVVHWRRGRAARRSPDAPEAEPERELERQ
jgi:membrane protein DedA with SNARE-associated domain